MFLKEIGDCHFLQASMLTGQTIRAVLSAQVYAALWEMLPEGILVLKPRLSFPSVGFWGWHSKTRGCLRVEQVWNWDPVVERQGPPLL